MDGFDWLRAWCSDGISGRKWGVFGGLAILLGLLTRPAALVLSVTMLVAIFSVHFSHGLFLSNGGYEFGLALLAGSVSLLISGAGRLSLDNLLLKRLA